MSFLIIFFAHLLADFPLQGSFLAEMKGRNTYLLVAHAGIWSGCVAIAGYLIGFDVGFIDIFLLFTVHAIADYLKASNKLWYKNTDPLMGGLIIDQTIHVGQIFLFILANI